MAASSFRSLKYRLAFRYPVLASLAGLAMALLGAGCGSEVKFAEASGGQLAPGGGKGGEGLTGGSSSGGNGSGTSGGSGNGGLGGEVDSGGSGSSAPCPSGFLNGDGDCRAFRHCKPGTFVTREGTPTRDRACGPCEDFTFSDQEDATMCTDWTRCAAAYFEAVKGSLVHDAVCEPKPWTRQVGVDDGTFANVVAVTADAQRNVFVAGVADGTLTNISLLDGERPGGADMFVIKYDARGQEKWAVQFGTTGYDLAYALALDPAGNLYVAGVCAGDLGQQANGGGDDGCLFKLDGAGQLIWTDLVGGEGHDSARSVATDSKGGVYLAGSTSIQLGEDAPLGEADAFLRKYDDSGRVQWTSQFGSDAFDVAVKVALDKSDNVFVAGNALGTLPEHASSGSQDIFVGKWSSSGKRLWLTAATSAPSDTARTLAVDDTGRTYVGGSTNGRWPNEEFVGAYYDALLIAFDANGQVRWVDGFGTEGNDGLGDLAVHGNRLWGVGETTGFFGKPMASGYYDGFTMHRDLDGLEMPTLAQFGTPEDDGAYSVTVDNEGSVIVGGYTEGSMNDEELIGAQDGFVWKVGVGK